MGTCWIFVKTLVVLCCTQALFAANGSPVASLSGVGSSYRGKHIGRFVTRAHKVNGDVYATDARTIHIRGFSYDGLGPDAFFWTGFTETPSPQGIIIPDEKGSKDVLRAYNNQDVTITLPDGLTLRDVKWLSVWCRAYEVNFGDLMIPADLDYPQPHVIGSLNGQHGVASGPIVVVDAQTILLPDFSYDGQAPDVHFWVGRGKLGPEGTRVPDETGSDAPLVKSDKKTMVLSLPGDLTIFDIDYFGVWCRLYYVDFGHVRVPKNLNVPPSLKMLGVTPQTKLNCEVLQDDMALEVRWAVAGESIVMQLVGRIDEDDYMAFGLSGDETRSIMIGGDVVVGWFEKATGRGHVVDYFLDSKSQCSGRRGTCPDSRLQSGANNVRLLSAAVVNGFTMLTFQRPLKAHDDLDKSILTNGSQPVIWAVGPINQRQEASYHKIWNKEDLFIEFGRVPKWNCPAPEELTPSSITPTTFPSRVPALANLPTQQHVDSSIQQQQQQQSSQSQSQQQHQHHQQQQQQQHHTQTSAVTSPVQKESSISSGSGVETVKPSRGSIQSEDSSNKLAAWRVPPILCHEPEDRVFYSQMGPTGGKRGYSAITGHVGWGISWYINGLLVPEIYVVRGKTYTFVVEGGDNPEVPAKYHPFYITDDPEGGFQYKSQADKKNVRVFAGIGLDGKGENIPTATGRLCQWTEHSEQPADSFASYGAYQRSLSLHCDDGHPGILHWTPDENTPDLVYYQCYTHRYLGWKIHVVDSCESGSELSVDATQNLPSAHSSAAVTIDQEVGESIQQSLFVPNNNHISKNSPVGGGEGNPIDSGEARVQSVVDGANGKSKLPEHKFSPDKSPLNEKQEYVLPARPLVPVGPSQSPLLLTRPEHVVQQYRRPLPQEAVHLGSSGYLQVPQSNLGLTRPALNHATHTIHGAPQLAQLPQYAPVQYQPETHTILRSPEGHHPYLSYADHYGQRLVDGSGLIYEPRTGLDYFVGPTGRPTLALAPHQLRYEGIPGGQVIYASTMAPQILTSPRYEPQGKVEYASPGKILMDGSTLQRHKQPTVGPQAGLSSEVVKLVDYVPAHYRVGSSGPGSGGLEGKTGVRVTGRPQQSRNLPKREQMRHLGLEAEEEIRMRLKSMGAENVGDDSNFEIIKINDTDNLPFGLPQEIVQAVQERNKSQKVDGVLGRNPTKREQEQEQIHHKSASHAFHEFPMKHHSSPLQVYYADGTAENRGQGYQKVQRGSPLSLPRGNSMSKKFKDDAELDGLPSRLDLISPEDLKMIAQLQSAQSEAQLTKFKKQEAEEVEEGEKGKKGVLSGHRDKVHKPYTPGFDPYSVVPQNGGFKPLVSKSSDDHDKTLYEGDSAPAAATVIQVPHGGGRYPLHRLQESGNFPSVVRREYVTLEQESHPKSFKQPQFTVFKLNESGRDRESQLPIKELLAVAANERLPMSSFRAENTNSRPPAPRLGAARPGAILTYDGRPLEGNNGGVSIRPNSDIRTPSVLHRPQFATFRGELPPPVPDYVPENLPQLAPQQRGNPPPPQQQQQQQQQQRQSRPPRLSSSRQQQADASPSASNRNSVRVPAPYSQQQQQLLEQHRPQFSLRPTASNSNLEIIPNDDVTMVVLKGTDEQGIQRELPKILHQLGSEAEGERKLLQKHQPQLSSLGHMRGANLKSSSARAEKEESTQVLQQQQQQQQQQQKEDYGHQNSTDLHILTDIWSIINQDDASRVQLERQNIQDAPPQRTRTSSMLYTAPRSQSDRPSSFNSETYTYRHQRQVSSDESLNEKNEKIKSVKKRSPDHEPGHTDGGHDSHDHDHSHNSASTPILSAKFSVMLTVLSYIILK